MHSSFDIEWKKEDGTMFLGADEVEAVGIYLLSELEEKIQECSSRPITLKRTNGQEANINRDFGGLN
eukprot:8348104-Karenia_brevis.AAC.1